jgi:TP901 family phage tail tape measure protein
MEVAQIMAKLEADITQFNATLMSAKTQFGELKRQIESSNFEIPPIEMPEMSAEKINKAWQMELSRENDAFKKAGADAERVAAIRAQEAAEATKRWSDNLNEALGGVKQLTSLGAAVGFMTKDLLSIGSGFESQMARVQAISGASADQFADLTARARELGATLPITARDAGAAMEVLAQRGVAVGSILEQVDDIINLSISQQYGLAESADAVSAAMLNFEMSVDKTAEIVDAFNNASNQSALSMSSLGSALSYVAPNAHAVGMDLYETVAAMEALANAGFAGHRIGTGLTDVISSLAAPTDKAAQALSRLGVQVNDSAGKMRPLRDILADLKDANMGFADSVAIFGTAGAKYGAVLAQNSNQLKGFEAGLKKSGATAANVAIQMQTLQNKWNAFKSAAEEVKITAFDQIKGKAGGFADELTELARVTGEWVTRTNLASDSLTGFLSGLGIGDGTITSLKNNLTALTATRIEEFFESSGKAVRGVVEAISKLASAVPWDFLINNLDTIAKSLFWSMIADKGISIAGNIGKIVGGVKGMGKMLADTAGPLTNFGATALGLTGTLAELGPAAATSVSGIASLAVGTAAAAGTLTLLAAGIGVATYATIGYIKAIKEQSAAEKYGKGLEAEIAQREILIRALDGEEEAVFMLNAEYRKLYDEKMKAREDDKNAA